MKHLKPDLERSPGSSAPEVHSRAPRAPPRTRSGGCKTSEDGVSPGKVVVNVAAPPEPGGAL